MTIYDIGDLVRCSATFAEAAGNPKDPTGVAFSYKPAAGATVVLVFGEDEAVVRSSTGKYHIDLAIDASGYWYYRWSGTGAVQTSSEDFFMVRPTAL